MATVTTELSDALEAVADAIDRWGAYAHETRDDALVRHHLVRERVRRAERSAALAAASIAADGDALGAAREMLTAMRTRAEETRAELTRYRTDLAAITAAAAEVRRVLDQQLAANLDDQRRLATTLAADARADQLARAALRDALERQRTLPRRTRAAHRSAALQALATAEATAHQSAEALRTTASELDRVRRRHQQITTAMAGLDSLTEEAASDLRAVDDGLHELGICGEHLELAEQAERRGDEARERAAAREDDLAETARRARAHLDAADAEWASLDAEYETAQRVATDAGLALRDVLLAHRASVSGGGDA